MNTVRDHTVNAAAYRLPIAATFFSRPQRRPHPIQFNSIARNDRFVFLNLVFELFTVGRCFGLVGFFDLFFSPSNFSFLSFSLPPCRLFPHPTFASPPSLKHPPTTAHSTPLLNSILCLTSLSTKFVFSLAVSLHLLRSCDFRPSTATLLSQCPRHSLRVLLPPPLATSTTLTKEVMEPPVENGMPYFFALL